MNETSTIHPMSYFCFPLHYLPAVPHAPTLAGAARLYELQLNCSFGSEANYCNVTIEINGTMMSATGNSTFYGLVRYTLYPTSARAINRCGEQKPHIGHVSLVTI